MNSRWVIVLGAVFAMAGSIAIWVSVHEPETPHEAVFEQPSGEPDSEVSSDAGVERGYRWSGETRVHYRDAGQQEDDEPGRRAWGGHRRRGWTGLSEEELRAIRASRVRITPRGETAPAITAEQVNEAVDATREQIRECIEENGGYDSLRREMRGSYSGGDAGAGRRRNGMSVSFDVTSAGRVDPNTIALEPAPPEPFYECYANAYGAMELPSPGGDGASIEVRVRPGGRRGQRSGT